MKSQCIYDEVSHEWDEQVDYLILPQYKDCYVLYPQHLRASHYDTDNEDVMKELCGAIKDIAIWSEEDGVYIVKENKLMDLLENFYKRGEKNEGFI